MLQSTKTKQKGILNITSWFKKTPKPLYGNFKTETQEKIYNRQGQEIEGVTNRGKELEEQTGVKSKPSEEVLTNIEIEDSPFRLVGNKELGYWIASGNYKITNPTKTKQETLIKLQKEKWNIVVSLVWMLLDVRHKFEEQPNKAQQ